MEKVYLTTQTKIKIVIILIIFLVSFAVFIFLRSFLGHTSKIDRNDAISKVKIQSEVLASSVNVLNDNILMLVNTIETLRENGIVDRDIVIELCKDLWKINNNIFGVKIAYESNMYDKLDNEDNGGDGVFFPYIYQKNNEFVVESGYNDENSFWFEEFMQNPKNYFVYPMNYVLGNGEKVSVASVHAPIFNEENKVIGVGGIDYDTSLFEKILETPIFDKHNAFIITKSGDVLASYYGLDEKFNDKYFLELKSFKKMSNISFPGYKDNDYDIQDNMMFITLPFNVVNNSKTLLLCYCIEVPNITSFITKSNINSNLFFSSIFIIVILLLMLLNFSLYKPNDSLTGLYTREIIKDRFPNDVKNCHKRNEDLSVIMADLDNFKVINDTYGHLCGDYVLKTFASILKSNVRKNDWICRYGGEEFLICLNGASRETAVDVAERIRQQVYETKFTYENISFNITVSLGINNLKATNEVNCNKLIDGADKNLYIAKQTGRNRVV